MSREHYRKDLLSVTQLLRLNGYYAQFPEDPVGYYLKRGNWVNAACDIVAQNQQLDDRTIALGIKWREKPLVSKDENKREQWMGYVDAYRSWKRRFRHFRLVLAQHYILNLTEGYQGTLDQVCELDDLDGVVELKAVAPGAACPPATPLQTAGYYLGLDPRPRLRIGLALRADGTYKESFYNDYRDIQAFKLMVRWNNISGNYR